MEVIDAANLKVLGEVEAADEEIDGNYKFPVGVLDKNVLIRSRNLNTGNEFVAFLYERANHLELTRRIEEVFAGKLPELNVEYLTIKKGADFLVVGISETFPHTSVEPIVKFRLTNNRRETTIDGRERDVWNLYASVETGKLLLAEMKRTANQIGSQV